MTLQVLISCMHQTDHSIVTKSNIQSDVIVVNQCDKNQIEEYSFKNKIGKECRVKFISTTERGLSRSRNMAIKNATADICLICDDDEVLDDDYPTKIIDAFTHNPESSIIAFQLQNTYKTYPSNKKNIGYINALKLASWQLAFKREDISANNIFFDETLGSGVSKAGGEENMFLYDCLKSRLKILYVPQSIGRMIDGPSLWFKGYTEDFFHDKGVLMRKLMGKRLGYLYAVYFWLSKYPLYKDNLTMSRCWKSIHKGLVQAN